MSEWLVVARREFAERVRTIWFIIVTLLGPVGLIAIVVVPAYLTAQSAKERTVIQVVDKSERDLFPLIVRNAAMVGSNFVFEKVNPDIETSTLLGRIRDEKINGFLLVPKDVLDGKSVTYRGDNATNLKLRMHLVAAVNAAAFEVRAIDAKLPYDTIAKLGSPKIDVIARHDTGHGEASSAEATFIVGYAVMFILYMAILLYAVNVLRSVVQEKTSRVIEIVVSAAKPRALMLGKVIGVGSVGLFQLTLWALMALVVFGFRSEILGMFGIEGVGDIDMPNLGVLDVVLVLVYFSFGYFFYAALYAAIGAMVNSEQEAQQAQTPIVILLIIPVVCVQLVANDPRGGIAQLLTMIPFSSPVLMPMRYLLDGATPMEVVISLAILILAMFIAVEVAARIYRVGILMYGKRPSVREVIRWIRYS